MRTPTTDRLRVEYGIYPNFDHSDYTASNPCGEQHVDCEGDCPECPNKDFFALAEEAREKVTRREIAILLREKADYMDRLAEKWDD